MKLASLKAGGRDGTLVVVSKDLTRAVDTPSVAKTLRDAIENWASVVPALQEVYTALNGGTQQGAFALDMKALAAPLPRSFQWLDGSAYLSHAELVRKARNADIPESMYSEPMIYQGGSDCFLGPFDDIVIPNADWGIDLESEIAIITDDVPMSVSAADAPAHIKLVMLVNDVSLRNLMPAELAKGFGFLTSKPSTAFSPVAVTPDELGAAWDGKKLSAPVESRVNDEWLGNPDAGKDLNFDFAQLIAFATKSRELRAGTIIGSGTVSNRDQTVGSSCLQEKRMIEKIETGAMKTPLLQFGDIVKIEAFDADKNSLFGEICQKVVRFNPAGTKVPR